MGEHPWIVWVSMLYMDTQIQGVSHRCTSSQIWVWSVMGGYLWMVRDSLGVHGYSDTGGQSWLYILGLSGIFWVWSVMGGYLWMIQDSLGILGVQGYLDKGSQSYGWTSSDSPG